MKLDLTDDQRLLTESFSRLFREESTPARVRAAQPLGFDADLWRRLGELGAISMRSDGFSLLDAALVMEEAGRWLAAVPLAESMIGTALLKAYGGAAADFATQPAAGRPVVTLALHEVVKGRKQVIPAGAIADVVIYLQGEVLVAFRPESRLSHVTNMAGLPIAEADLLECKGSTAVIAQGPNARGIYAAACEEWKVLTAAALVGLSRQALEMAAKYAGERAAFGQLIGAFQGLSHPLADCAIDTDGARLFLWRTICAIADNEHSACSLISSSFWWATRAACRSVAIALHTFGGYGLTIEYDIHLYNLRAKGWPLVMGDPETELQTAARRMWAAERVDLPNAGNISIDFKQGAAADALADEIRRFFRANLTPDIRAKAHYSYDGHNPAFYKALGQAGLLFPGWPQEYGGRGLDSYAAAAALSACEEFDWTVHPQTGTNMVGHMVIRFGSPELRAEVLPVLRNGLGFCSLGLTEPHCGSDVFAARTQAIRDGDDWVINGQKMFTSGANLAEYVFLLTRTDPNAPKHKGITIFLVPLKTPGIEVRPIFTFQDERTNTTFYSDVRIPDRYRLGPVNGGIKVMSAALELEQGGGGYASAHRKLFDIALQWAKTTVRADRPLIEEPNVRARLARVAANLEISNVLCYRALWAAARGVHDAAYGPMSKVFTTEAFIRDSADILDLMAPEALLRHGKHATYVEQCYRHSAATSIYGGTTEVLRSMIAEKNLGLPRSRL
jgi:alkylation response protein AidB-like acyl-CoA dehydrogenase